MLKKINIVLNLIISSFIGVFVGQGIYIFYDYKTHPSLYEMQSAPWYTSVLVYGIITILVLITAISIKRIIQRKLKGR